MAFKEVERSIDFTKKFHMSALDTKIIAKEVVLMMVTIWSKLSVGTMDMGTIASRRNEESIANFPNTDANAADTPASTANCTPDSPFRDAISYRSVEI